MVFVIEAAPFQALHFLVIVRKDTVHPVNDGMELLFNRARIGVMAMLGKVGFHVGADHLDGDFLDFLTHRVALDVLQGDIVKVRSDMGELFLEGFHMLAGIDAVEDFHVREGNSLHVDGLEPVVAHLLASGADAHRDFRAENLVLHLFREGVEVERVAVDFDGELFRVVADDGRKALLAVKDFGHRLTVSGEVAGEIEANHADGEALEDGVNDLDIALAVPVYVETLIFGLNDDVAVKGIEALVFGCIEDGPIHEVADFDGGVAGHHFARVLFCMGHFFKNFKKFCRFHRRVSFPVDSPSM